MIKDDSQEGNAAEKIRGGCMSSRDFSEHKELGQRVTRAVDSKNQSSLRRGSFTNKGKRAVPAIWGEGEMVNKSDSRERLTP